MPKQKNTNKTKSNTNRYNDQSILAISGKKNLYSRYKIDRDNYDKVEYYLDIEKLDISETFLFSRDHFSEEYFFLFEVQKLLEILVDSTRVAGFLRITKNPGGKSIVGYKKPTFSQAAKYYAALVNGIQPTINATINEQRLQRFYGQSRLIATPSFIKAKQLSTMYNAFSEDYEIYKSLLPLLPDLNYGDAMFSILSEIDNAAFDSIKKTIDKKVNWANVISGPKIPNKRYLKNDSLTLIEQIGKQFFDEYLLFPKELYFFESSNKYIEDFYNYRTKISKSNAIKNKDYNFDSRRNTIIENKHSLLDTMNKSNNAIVGEEANIFLKKYFKPIKKEAIKRELLHKTISNRPLYSDRNSLDLEANFLDNDAYEAIFNRLKDNPFDPENLQNLLIALDEFITLTFMAYEVNKSKKEIQKFDEWKTDFQNFPFATANQLILKNKEKIEEQNSNQRYEEVLKLYTTTYIDPLKKKIDVEKKELQRKEEEVAAFEELSTDEQVKKAQEFYTELLNIADFSNEVKKQNPNPKNSNAGLELLSLLFDEE